MTPALAPEQRHATPGPPPFAGMAIEPRYVPDDAYNIRHDPEAPDKVAQLLLAGYVLHPGQPVHIGKALGSNDVWAIHAIIEALRRVGHIIDGEKGVAGYTYRGFKSPPKWLHIDHVMRDVVRDMLDGDRVTVAEGQMELVP